MDSNRDPLNPLPPRGLDLGERHVVEWTTTSVTLRGNHWVGVGALVVGIGALLFCGFLGWMVFTAQRGTGRAFVALSILVPFGFSAIAYFPMTLVTDEIDGIAKTVSRRRWFGLYRKTWYAAEFRAVCFKLGNPNDQGVQMCRLALEQISPSRWVYLGGVTTNPGTAGYSLIELAKHLSTLLQLPREQVGEFAERANYDFRDAVESAAAESPIRLE